jgi:anti-anti-sigma factor
MSLKLARRDWIPRRTQAFICSPEDCGGEVAEVHLVGELRAASAPELARTLRWADGHARLVVLDIRRLTLIDPCGVHVVVAAAVRARRANRRVVVVRGTAQVDPVFAFSAASTAIDVVELEAWQPAVQALLELARDERAA